MNKTLSLNFQWRAKIPFPLSRLTGCLAKIKVFVRIVSSTKLVTPSFSEDTTRKSVDCFHADGFYSYAITSFIAQTSQNRSRPPEVFLGKRVLKICSKFTEKHRRVISAKLICNFTEITLRHGCSAVNLLHVFRTSFYKDTSEGLLLTKTVLKLFLLLSKLLLRAKNIKQDQGWNHFNFKQHVKNKRYL